MEYEYSAIGYNSLYNEVSLMISKLQSINIDVSKYNSLVYEININLKKDINDRLVFKKNNLNDNNDYIFDFGIESIYEPYITRLINIKKSLLGYEGCFVINNTCNYINNGIDSIDIDILVKNSINCLKYVKNIKVLDYSVLFNMLDNLYNIILKVIKKEILINSSSDLLNYILLDDVYILGLDNTIKKYITNNKLDKINIINLRCMELDSSKLNSNYVDIDLLKMIVFEENKDGILGNDVNNIKNLYNDFVRNDDKINSNRFYLNYSHKIDDTKKSFNKSINCLLKQGIPLGIISSLILYGGIFFLPKADFLKEKKYSYNSKKTTYVDGELDSVEFDKFYRDKIINKRNIIIYDYKDSNHSVYIYNDSYDDKVDINELFTVDLENYDKVVRTTSSEDDIIAIGSDRAVVITENNKLGIEMVRNNFLLVAIEIDYFWLLFILDNTINKKMRKSNLIVEKLYLLIKNFILNGVEYSKDRRKYKEDLNKIIDGIKSNEIIRGRFNTVYHEFVSKYGEIDELRDMYNKVNNVKYDDVLMKKKVKI